MQSLGLTPHLLYDMRQRYVFCVALKVRVKQYSIWQKVKVKVTLEQASKAQRGSRGLAVLFL